MCSLSLFFQSLLCGPSLSVDSIGPLLERLPNDTIWGLSLHLLCATRRGHYESSIEKLLDCCPQAIIAYANHHLQDKNMVCTDLNCVYSEVAYLLMTFYVSPLCEAVLVAEAAP